MPRSTRTWYSANPVTSATTGSTSVPARAIDPPVTLVVSVPSFVDRTGDRLNQGTG